MSGVEGQEDGIETTRQLLKRWALAATFVTAVHGGVALAVAHWPKPETTAGEPPAAVLIELAPEIAAPEAPLQEVAVGVEQEQSDDSTPTEVEDEPEEKLPEPEPLTAEAPSEILPEEIPELPEIRTAEAVIEVPTKEPEPEPAEEKKPEEPEKKVEKKKPKPKRKSTAQAAAAPRPVDAARSKTNAAPSSGIGSSMSMATWRGSVIAHLNRAKRAPGGSRGTATVAFSIDRKGRVLSARLVRSSGNASLDREAVALVRRASPVPPPPANIHGNSVLLKAPVSISR